MNKTSIYNEAILEYEVKQVEKSRYKKIKLEIGKYFEGCELSAYRDTVGKWTVGIGNNFDDMGFTEIEEKMIRARVNDYISDIKTIVIDKGITQEEADLMYLHDSKVAEDDCRKLLENFDNFDDVRKAAVCDFCFNVGYSTFRSFKNTRHYLDLFDFKNAASGFRNSLWYKQVGRRSPLICEMIETGEIPDKIKKEIGDL